MTALDCFTVVPHARPGFLGRILGRKVKENAFIEVQNLLARKPLEDLSAADVETILSDYGVQREQAIPRFQEMYRVAVKFLASDDELSEADRAAMKQLRYILGLDDGAVAGAEQEVLRELYRTRLKAALSDQQLSDVEKKHLEAITRSFALPESAHQSIYKEEVHSVIQQAFTEALVDRRLTDAEEKRLAAMGKNLDATWTYDAEAEQQIARFRLLAQIEAGQLPKVSTPLSLHRGETCHGQLTCELHEKRTVTKAIRYHGPAGRIRIAKGLSWRYGSVAVDRVTSEELRRIDAGTLYITSKRLLFDGDANNKNIPYNKIVKFTIYKDGLGIEKESGRDQYFLGAGDLEVLGAVLETCIRLSREG